MVETDASGNAATPTDPFGFDAQSGYYLDRETGASYCQNRYYAPSMGRWLERDPIGRAGGINQYAYCAAQPVGNEDPSGLSFWGWGDDQWVGFSRWWSGRHDVDPHGHEVTVGGIIYRAANRKKNAETYGNYTHLYDEQDFSNYCHDDWWMYHEAWHRKQEGGAATWVWIGAYLLEGYKAYRKWDANGRPHQPGGPDGHDYNFLEMDADRAADHFADRKTGKKRKVPTAPYGPQSKGY